MKSINWRELLIFIMLILLSFIFINYSFESISKFSNYSLLTFVIIFLLIILFSSTIKNYIFSMLNPKKLLSLKNICMIFFSALLAITLMEIIMEIELFTDETVSFYWNNNLHKNYDLYEYISNLFLSPLWEEIFFRGILYGYLSLLIENKWISILLSVTLFTLFHSLFPVIGLVYSIIFLFVFIKTKSLICVIITHTLINVYVTFDFYIF